MRTMNCRLKSALVAAITLLLAPVAFAAEVGTVASLEGSADIGRNGAWIPAAIGSPLQIDDLIKTGRPGKVRIVFQDDSVLAVSDDSEITINDQVFSADQGKAKSMMELLRGKVTAVVSDYYHRTGNTYEIKTVTAVAGVRGTEFAMTFDPLASITEVVGVSGHVEVHSLIDPTGPGVLLTANEATTIEEGKLPTRPRRLDDTRSRQQLEGFDFVGIGRSAGLSASHAAAGAGATVPAVDSASAVTTRVATWVDSTAGLGDASGRIGKSPQVIKDMGGQLGIGLGH